MKKNYFVLGLMLTAALTLTNCAKEKLVNEPVAEQKGVPFELSVGVDTKTTTEDGVTINWTEKDSLNVFHAEAGTTTYGKNDKFTFDSGSKFTGTLQDGALTAEKYDWYVLYPYNEAIETPANKSKGFSRLGSYTATTSQKQAGNSSKAHLASGYYPLYGKATNVSKDTKPSIQLKQALSVVKVHVTNTSAKSLVVNNVSFTAPNDSIAGTFFIDFTGDEPVFTKSGKDFVSKTASLSVTGGTAIANDGTAAADFYIAIRPFSLSSGKLVLSVNGYEKECSVSSLITFAPGKIKTLNFVYDKVEAAPIATPVTVGFESSEGFTATTSYNNTDVKFQGADGHRWGIVSGSTSTTGAIKGSQSLLLRDYTANSFQPYAYTEYRLSTVKEIQFKAKNYSDGYNLKLSYSEDFGETWTDVKTFTLTTEAAEYGHVFETAVASAMFKFTVVFPETRTNKKDVIIDNVIFSDTAIVPAPVITVTSDNPMDVANTASAQEITYTIENPTEATLTAITTADWITGISTATADKVTFNVAAQEAGAAARTAKITLKYTGAEDVEVTVNQEAGEGGGIVITWTRSGTTDTVTSGYSLVTTTAKSQTGYYQDKSGSEGLDIRIKKSDNSALFTSTPSTISVTATIGGGSTKDPLANNMMVCLVDETGAEIDGTATLVTSKVEVTTGKDYTVTIPNVESAYAVKFYHVKESGFNIRIYGASVTITE